MRRLLAPLSGITLVACAAVWVASEAARPDPVTHPMLAASLPPQHAASLPKVGPFPPDHLRPPSEATTQASGTGFYVAPHAVITAAHVVNECRDIRLISQHLPPTSARLVAADPEHDIAVLDSTAPAPAILDIASTAAVPTHVLVYGFPATARRDTPNSTWAGLVNDSFTHATALEKDPRTLLWMQNRDIAHGYSGGPILNPANGQVLGFVRALIDPQRAAAAYGINTPDLSIGPGSAPLRMMLARETIDHGAAVNDTDDIFTRARKATVHVVCWQ